MLRTDEDLLRFKLSRSWLTELEEDEQREVSDD